MKRVIFDLDGTLLTGSFDKEKEYFNDIYGEDANDLIENIPVYLDQYEKTFPRYNHELLSEFLSEKSGLEVNSDIIDGWIDFLSDVPDKIEDGVINTLEHLKSRDCSLAVLTNWYGGTQIPRLRKAGILHYFDNIYTGDFVLKPHKRAYIWAIDDYDVNDCLFVGDNVDKDYIGPRIIGAESIIYDKNDIHHKSLRKVKRIDEIVKK